MADERLFTHLLCGQVHARGAGCDDREIGALAARQRGVVARRQLLALGVSGRAIDHRLATGRLTMLFPGTYAVGHDAVPELGRVHAAVLATSRPFGAAPRGPVAASHITAAALWSLAETQPGAVHVTAVRSRRNQRGLFIHRASLPADEIRIVSGIPVTSVPRTLLDLSASHDEWTLRRTVKQAEFLGLVEFSALAAILARYPRRPGRRALAEVVGGAVAGAGRTRSELEDRFLELCRRHSLPLPETNVLLEIRGEIIEVDAVWRDERVAVELDGYRAHGTRSAFEADRARDRALAASGWVPLRVTWAQLHPGRALAQELRDTLETRRRTST